MPDHMRAIYEEAEADGDELADCLRDALAENERLRQELNAQTDATDEWKRQALGHCNRADRLQSVLHMLHGEIAQALVTDSLHVRRPVPCADGSLIHDFKGQATCSGCGMTGIQLAAHSDGGMDA